MKPKDIDRFFRVLSQEWPHPTKIILTGGGYALLQGGSRTTEDLDFEVTTSNMDGFSEAVKETAQQTHIPPQFSEDIGHWSPISHLDYKRKAVPYKEFGKIRVYLHNPIYWGIGKVARYLNQDITDLVSVYSKLRPNPILVAKIWRRALEESPQSTTLFLAKKNALAFFKMNGKRIWGKGINLEEVERTLR